ncbi:hypothetical protein VP01_3630g2 [Puccinia sorghi]|uniref:Uncharacterized protein n=1 Tax=Puccinia sorghi TaxID=27349 RepID=A0A0L6UVG9_9BASI|nr:hypothetical protein VP01_3630g2 [Puccinia sorghi]
MSSPMVSGIKDADLFTSFVSLNTPPRLRAVLGSIFNGTNYPPSPVYDPNAPPVILGRNDPPYDVREGNDDPNISTNLATGKSSDNRFTSPIEEAKPPLDAPAAKPPDPCQHVQPSNTIAFVKKLSPPGQYIVLPSSSSHPGPPGPFDKTKESTACCRSLPCAQN